jgi:hypothetical protein
MRAGRYTLVLALPVLFVAACSEQAGRHGGEEIWIVDFQTFGSQLAEVLDPHGIACETVSLVAIECMRDAFAGLPIEFRLGTSAAPGENYICVRQGEDDALGRGILDLGNTGFEFACGERHGLPFGVFIDNVLHQIVAQGAEVTDQRVGRMLGVILAHEVGHGLGLVHSTAFAGSGDIMNGNVLDVGQEDFYFTEEHVGVLRRNLGVED